MVYMSVKESLQKEIVVFRISVSFDLSSGFSSVPTAAPRDIAVEVFNTTVLRVSWTPVPPATVRGHIGGYNVSSL